MENTRERRRLRDWYSISVDTVRLWLSGTLALFLLGVGYLGYLDWQERRLERSAFAWVARSETLLGQAQTQSDVRVYREELSYAEGRLERARASLELRDFADAERHGRDAHQVLSGILEAQRLARSIAWFRSVQGDVRFRRGERGEFQRAFARIELQDGDYVMSSANSSAEIHFREEDAVFTLRPGSLVKLTRQLAGRQKTLGEMEYGWVALSTSETSTGVRTRSADLIVAENSRASVALEQGRGSTEIRVDSGEATARSSGSGESRRLGGLQKVELRQDGTFGATVDLPERVDLTAPEDGQGVNIDAQRDVVLEWDPQPGAVRYALQVSGSRLFAETYVDVTDRRRPSTRLGLREPGTFAWRVAAIDGRGNQGPWSESRWLRVDSYRNLALEVDRSPPALEVEVFLSGNLALVQGRTEPGATLEVNGEEISVAADGTFVSTRWLFGAGRIPLTFRAVDAAGNDTVRQHWVYLDEA
ncbi:MAG: hypothetical protein DWQ36_24910 [Acidobacteria bacterium]|nr:MAG: hypothetical protein DWQ30_10950 [Acidobacteriota bacterium]REJ99576.1 MAG: hypothetical protein DWQ36_24910 [Acidobacteriota bacterium]